MNGGQTVEARDLEAVGDHERQYAQHEASASNYDRPIYSLRKVRLRRAFLTLCAVDLVTIIAIGAFSVQQWRGPAWNSPIWPMLPLLLNRFIEIGALLLKNHFTSITTSAVQVFLAVINLILCTQRASCAVAPFSGCVTVILAVCILFLEILIAVIVTLWVNWAHFMDWATANGAEMALAAEGLSGQDPREASTSTASQGRRHPGAGKKFVGVVQPSEKSFAVAIVVDAMCTIRAPPQHPGRSPQAHESEVSSDQDHHAAEEDHAAVARGTSRPERPQDQV
ncbi:g3654 [Coccomyxa elongata]